MVVLCEDTRNFPGRIILKPFIRLTLMLAVLTAGLANAFAQTPQALEAPLKVTGVSQSAINSLSALPEADTLIYINPQRILNEAAPLLMPEKDLAAMRSGFEQMRQDAGVDPTKIEFLVIAVRFRQPAADLSFALPEIMAVAGGDFSADSLLMIARRASGGRLRDETYGAKTLGLMTIDPIAREAEKTPMLKPFSELGIVALNATTIAFGSVGYLKAAVDAGEGTGRISPASLASLFRDQTVLMSAAGSPWRAFAKSFGMHGTQAAPRTPRCESQLGDFYVAVTMDATNFLLRGSMHADNPDTAKIMRNLAATLMGQAAAIPDPGVQQTLKSIALTAEENEVVVNANIPQQVVVQFLKSQIAPKQDAAPATKPTQPSKRRRPARRTRRTA